MEKEMPEMKEMNQETYGNVGRNNTRAGGELAAEVKRRSKAVLTCEVRDHSISKPTTVLKQTESQTHTCTHGSHLLHEIQPTETEPNKEKTEQIN